MVWKPHVTVAAVIYKENKFLLVEEQIDQNIVFNQPAGHLEPGETIISAVKREVNEETAWHFEPDDLVALQLWRKTVDSPSFLRICLAGSVHSYDSNQPLDHGIIKTHWLSRDDIMRKKYHLRSPLVLKTIETFLAGQRYPLSLLESYLDVTND